MNIQIFGKKKCFDTKKAQRYFKERRIKVQDIDLPRFGLSPRELESVIRACSLENLIDETADGAEILTYLAHREDKIAKLLEYPEFLKTPIVRNGKQTTVGFAPEIWKEWQ